jgi:hypothetical protein
MWHRLGQGEMRSPSGSKFDFWFLLGNLYDLVPLHYPIHVRHRIQTVPGGSFLSFAVRTTWLEWLALTERENVDADSAQIDLSDLNARIQRLVNDLLLRYVLNRNLDSLAFSTVVS